MRDDRVLLAVTLSFLGTGLEGASGWAQSPGIPQRPLPIYLPASGFTHPPGAFYTRTSHNPDALEAPVQQPAHRFLPQAQSSSTAAARAQATRSSSNTRLSASATTSSPAAQNLDLSSTAANLTVSGLAGSVRIKVGGTEMTVTSSTLLTPAEKVAVYQVERTGKQLLILNAQGSADGGTVVLSKSLSADLGNLDIPAGVTVIDISKTGGLDLSGNLTDDGTLYVSTAGRSGSNVSIEAENISVQSGGSITDVMPSKSGAANSNLNLNVTAQDDLANSGTITSAGALNFTAGGSITNSSGGSSAPVATMQSQGNLNLTAGSGTVNNSGLVQSSNGNINIAAKTAASDIDVNAAGGTFQAANGAINLRDSSYSGAGNVNLAGGNYLSSALNINSGTGSANTNVNSIGGSLNVTAGEAHTLVSTGNLQVGNTSITGDPTYYDANGNLTITGNISVGEALSLAASGNILSTGNYTITANNGASGFDINVIAGANITPGAGGAITISGPSSTGGDVTFSSKNMTISSAAVSGNNNGGDINVVALANAGGTNGGHVTLSSGTTINAGGSGTGNNGNVQILAGANSGTAITTGSINTAGGSGSGGNILIQTTQPATNPNPLTIASNGTVAGTFVPGNTNAASVLVNAPITSGGNVTVESGNTVTINNKVTAATLGGDITIESPGNLTLAGNGSLTTTPSGTTSLLAEDSPGSSLTIAKGTNLTIGGGGQVDIFTPNLIFAGTSTLNATGASPISINPGTTLTGNVGLNIQGNQNDTISTNGGGINVTSTGTGNINFLTTGNSATTINLNSAGTGGIDLVDITGLGNITIPKNVTVASNSPLEFNIGNQYTDRTFTLNGTVKTTASNTTGNGAMPFSLLVQNLLTNFNLAGTGTFLQAGKTPGATVFNDYLGVNFLNGTNLTAKSLSKGSYVNFYTQEIGLEGTGVVSAGLRVQNVNSVNFETDLPALGGPHLLFSTGPSVTSGTLTISGAPVNVGFPGQTPPNFMPPFQQPLNSLIIGKGFNLVSAQPIALYANNNNYSPSQNSISVLGTVSTRSGHGNLVVQSPTGIPLDITGPGTLQGSLIVLNSAAPGDAVNFESDLTLLGNTRIGAGNGDVTIANGQTVTHKGSVSIYSQGTIPTGFNPSSGVTQSTTPVTIPSQSGVTIVTPNLIVDGGTVTATGSHR